MKRTLLMMVALVAFLVPSVLCHAGHDRIIPPEKLPAAAKTFVQQNFPGNTISYAKEDRDFMKTTYEARLDDGTEIDFTGSGEWDKVDCKYKAVPAAIVPAAIAQYVTSTFPGALIVKIDKERYGYEVELNNDLELKFNKQGALMYMDD